MQQILKVGRVCRSSIKNKTYNDADTKELHKRNKFFSTRLSLISILVGFIWLLLIYVKPFLRFKQELLNV